MDKASSLNTEQTLLRRQVVGFAKHTTSHEKYFRLNDSICAIAGEARSPTGITRDQVKQADVKLVFSVSEIIWEPPPD